MLGLLSQMGLHSPFIMTVSLHSLSLQLIVFLRRLTGSLDGRVTLEKDTERKKERIPHKKHI